MNPQDQAQANNPYNYQQWAMQNMQNMQEAMPGQGMGYGGMSQQQMQQMQMQMMMQQMAMQQQMGRHKCLPPCKRKRKRFQDKCRKVGRAMV